MNVHFFGAHDGITVDRGVGTDALAAAAERLYKRLILIKEGDEPRQMPARRKADRGDLIFRTAESLGAPCACGALFFVGSFYPAAAFPRPFLLWRHYAGRRRQKAARGISQK